MDFPELVILVGVFSVLTLWFPVEEFPLSAELPSTEGLFSLAELIS